MRHFRARTMISKRLVLPAALLAMGALIAPAASASTGTPTPAASTTRAAHGPQLRPSGPTWTCSTSGYLFLYPGGGPTTIYQIDMGVGTYTRYGQAADAVNAIGYNTLDNYMYGWDLTTGHLAGIDRDGKLTQLGVPSGMSPSAASGGFNEGDFDASGNLYLMQSASGAWDEVDLDPRSIHYDTVTASGTLTAPRGILGLPSDWAYTNNALYGMAQSRQLSELIMFNLRTRKLVNLGPVSNVPGDGVYGSAFGAPGGILWVADNNTGSLYRISLAGGAGEYVGREPAHDHADGARCGRAPAPDGPYRDAVTFIGDSVAAGFGYCGTAENAAGISCSVNEAMPNSWYLGANSLSKCDPPNPPNDACSNDNDDGEPWNAAPWTSGPKSPDIAFPYQIAASQRGSYQAAVSDWAVSGATPARWSPDGGIYADQLKKLDFQYVVVMLGANPLLSSYLDVTIAGAHVIDGSCVHSTGYRSGVHWYSGPISTTVKCAEDEWNVLGQTQNLVKIYETLLGQGDRVLVVGYYLGCPWSFGNWQPAASLLGPSHGHSCTSLSRYVSPSDHTKVTQWDQAVALDNAMNDYIHNAVVQAQDWARHISSPTDLSQDIAWALPDESDWAEHQPGSRDGSWIFLNDMWIHPSKEGHTELAHTVTRAMCARFHHWCGLPPVWG